ncbi:MAG: hypothetical protein ACR2P6_08030 [Gammaproteobacteria bacterium]
MLTALILPAVALAGGGVALQDDVCIIKIDFYSAHFTAYQPDTRGNEQFCEDLPDTGTTLFVLDYLHGSLKEVPVDFRIIKDSTGLGQFARLEHIQALEDIEQHTVFYRPPTIEVGGSYQVEHDFLDAGDYVGIVSAGHPSNDKTYYAVFPFTVGAVNYSLWLSLAAIFAATVFLVVWRKNKPHSN